MSEQPLDLRSVSALLWRGRRFLLGLALCGAAGGVTYAQLSPVRPGATALVLLPPAALSASGAPARDMNTEIAIARSSPVLSAAGQSVSPRLSAQDVRKEVKVSAVSEDVLSFVAHGRTVARAMQVANSVAMSYISYEASNSSVSSQAQSASIQQQTATLDQQLLTIQSQIKAAQSRLATEAPASPGGERDTSLVASLSAEEQAVSVQLNSLKQTEQAQANSQSPTVSTRLLQSAMGETPSHVAQLVQMAAEGTGVAVILTGIVIVARGRRDRTLRTRGEVANAAGVPVLASMSVGAPRTAGEWKQVLKLEGLGTSDVWAFKQILRSFSLERRPGSTYVRVISFTNDRAAAVAGAGLASLASATGTITRFTPEVQEATTTLRAACAALDRDHPLHTVRDPVELTVNCTVVDREGASHTFRPADINLLSISPGRVTADDIAGLALRMDEEGERLDGVILVNPDPGDYTVGVTDEPAGQLRSDPIRYQDPRRTGVEWIRE